MDDNTVDRTRVRVLATVARNITPSARLAAFAPLTAFASGLPGASVCVRIAPFAFRYIV